MSVYLNIISDVRVHG